MAKNTKTKNQAPQPRRKSTNMNNTDTLQLAIAKMMPTKSVGSEDEVKQVCSAKTDTTIFHTLPLFCFVYFTCFVGARNFCAKFLRNFHANNWLS